MNVRSTLSRRTLLALGGAAALLAAFGSASAASGLGRLSIVLGTIPGSVLDTVGRAFAAVAKQLDPTLQVDVQNLEGASSLLAFKDSIRATGNANVLYFLQGSLLYLSLSDSPDNADLGKQMAAVSLVGSLGADRRAVFAATSTGIADFSGLLAYPKALIVPTVTAASGSFFEAQMVNALTGAKLKPVGGYSSAERKLAILSGEANVAVGSADTFGELVDQGVLTPVLRLNDAGPDAPYANLPLLKSLAKGADADLLVNLIDGVADSNNLVLAPPGLTAPQLAVLTDLFDAAAAQLATLKDAGFGAAEAIASDRPEVLKHVGALFENREAVAAAFNRAQACGQLLGDGKSCA